MDTLSLSELSIIYVYVCPDAELGESARKFQAHFSSDNVTQKNRSQAVTRIANRTASQQTLVIIAIVAKCTSSRIRDTGL